MSQLFVAYEMGVYRHDTIGVALSEEELYPTILAYFKGTDDYHSVIVEALDVDNYIVEICYYKVRSNEVYVQHEWGGKYKRRHGERVVYRGEVKVDSFYQEYKLKDKESFVE